MSEKKYNTHCVLKNEDVEKYLDGEQKAALKTALDAISRGRRSDGKKDNAYYVCNMDEPYANDVIETILSGEDSKAAGEPVVTKRKKIWSASVLKEFDYTGNKAIYATLKTLEELPYPPRNFAEAVDTAVSIKDWKAASWLKDKRDFFEAYYKAKADEKILERLKKISEQLSQCLQAKAL